MQPGWWDEKRRGNSRDSVDCLVLLGSLSSQWRDTGTARGLSELLHALSLLVDRGGKPGRANS